MKYESLEQRIKSRGIKKSVIARALSITERSLRYKIQGTAPLTWEQACIIQDNFFPEVELKSLFRETEQPDRAS